MSPNNEEAILVAVVLGGTLNVKYSEDPRPPEILTKATAFCP